MSDEDDKWGQVLPNLKGKRTDWYVGHSKDGFTLTISATSSFRFFVETISDKFCVLTRHLFCNSIHINVIKWAEASEVVLYKTEIDRETADKLSWHYGTWSYLDDDEEDNEQ